jgi:hypothetical protein
MVISDLFQRQAGDFGRHLMPGDSHVASPRRLTAIEAPAVASVNRTRNLV